MLSCRRGGSHGRNYLADLVVVGVMELTDFTARIGALWSSVPSSVSSVSGITAWRGCARTCWCPRARRRSCPPGAHSRHPRRRQRPDGANRAAARPPPERHERELGDRRRSPPGL